MPWVRSLHVLSVEFLDAEPLLSSQDLIDISILWFVMVIIHIFKTKYALLMCVLTDSMFILCS